MYAGFWKRFAAIVIDMIIVGIGQRILKFMLGDTAAWLLDLVGSWLYFALLESSYNQGTLGKMIIGIKVTDMDGSRISFARATARHFSKIISSLILCIGYIMAGVTQRKQALHDMIASTLVVEK